MNAILDACDHPSDAYQSVPGDKGEVVIEVVCRKCADRAVEAAVMAARDVLEKKIRAVIGERNAMETNLRQARAEIERFPKRVKRNDARIAEAVLAEREACAQRCEDIAAANADMPDTVAIRAVAERIAADIRARGGK